MWAYNDRGKSSLLTHTDLGWYTSQWWPWLALPCLIFLHTVTQKHRKTPRIRIYTGTQIHSISLKCLGSWSFSRGGDWCWGETAIRETREDSVPVLSGFCSGLWSIRTLESGFWEHENLFKHDKWALEKVNSFFQIIMSCKTLPSIRTRSLSLWRRAEGNLDSFPAGCVPQFSGLLSSCLCVSVGAGLVTMCVFHQTSSHLPTPHPTALDHRTSRSTPLISLNLNSLFPFFIHNASLYHITF